MRCRAEGGGGIRVRTNPNTAMPTEKTDFNGQSVQEFFASFAYKGRGGGLDDGISGEIGRVDKKVVGKGLFSPNSTSLLRPRLASSSSLQNTTSSSVVVQEEGSRPFNGMLPDEFIASFAYNGGGKVNDRTSAPPPPLPPLQNKTITTSAAAAASASANQSQFARLVSRFFPHNPGDVVVDIKKNIAGNYSGEIGRVDKKPEQGKGLLSPNNTSLLRPRLASSSCLQNTINSSVVVQEEGSRPFNGMSPSDFIASFADKGKGKVDDRTSTPPPPPPPPLPFQNRGKTTATAIATATATASASATANQSQFSRRVTRFFPHNPGDIVVDIKKNIAGNDSEEIGRVDKKSGQGRGLLCPNSTSPLRPRSASSSSFQNTTNSSVVQEEGSRLFNGMSPAEFIASFAYKGGGKLDDRTSTPPPPLPPRPLQNRRKTVTTTTTATSAAANHSKFARRVTRYFPHNPGDIVVDVNKNIAGKRRADSGCGTTRKRPRMTGLAGSTSANRRQHKRKGRGKQRSVQLSAKEKFSDVYRRVSDQTMWVAPRSSHNLLQERHCFDPWRVLVICILLNVTNGKQVRKVLPGLFLLCPNAKAAGEGIKPQLVEKLRGLGLQHKRAQLIVNLSRRYLKDDWTHVTQLPGVGKYAADAYAIFAAGRLERVRPQDHKLVKYWKEVREMMLTARNR